VTKKNKETKTLELEIRSTKRNASRVERERAEGKQRRGG